MNTIKYFFLYSLLLTLLAPRAYAITELNIATVDNGHMREMQKLTADFEKQHPGIKLNWHVYSEGSLRMRVIADIAAGTSNYDVVTIGMYETPIWAERDWLVQFKPDAQYDVDDLLPAVRDGLSYQGDLYAAPFYGESSMLMYRKDLLQKAGIRLDQQPSWQQVKKAAAAINDPANEVYGICLRGKAGWGDNMALVSTMVNSFGGRWFDMNWQPDINSPSWKNAVNLYVDLLTQYGPPNAQQQSFNEILSLSRAGKCGMWLDASIAGSFLTDASQSRFADQWGFTQAPYARTTKGANWLWAWALAIPTGTSKTDAAQTFINWATSKQYIELVAKRNGWANVPTGTRLSTYDNPKFLKAAGDFAQAELAALSSADPSDNTLLPSPYSSIQFVSIPEFVAIGGVTGVKINEALSGKESVDNALQSAEAFAKREMRRANVQQVSQAQPAPVSMDPISEEPAFP